VQILVTGVESVADACDAISEVLSDQECFLDWAYLCLGGQMMWPTERYFDLEHYEEGEFIE
jgi:hypothetical protein